MRKSPCGTFFGLAAAIETRIRLPHRADVEMKNQAIIAHMKCAEKLYSPNEMVKSYGLNYLHSDRDRNKISPLYIRISTDDRVMSAAAARPKNVQQGLFRMFRLTHRVRAKVLRLSERVSGEREGPQPFSLP